MGANIPLPALAVNTQYPNPLDEYMRAVQLKSTMQQQQLQQGQIEQQQYALQDQRTLRSLAPKYVQKDDQGNVTGYDHDGFLNAATQAGVNPATLMKMEQERADMRDKLAQASTHELDAHDKANDQLFQLMEGVRSAAKQDPNSAQQAWQNALPRAQKLGAPVSSLPAQFPTQNSDQFIDQMESSLALYKQVIADAKQKQDMEKSAAETGKAKSEGQLAQMKADAMKQFGGLSPEMIEAKYITESMKPQGQRDQKFLDAVKNYKEIVPQFNIAMQSPVIPTNAAGGKDWGAAAKRYGLSPEALEQQVDKYYTSGAMPQIGRGGSGQGLQRLIMDRTAEKYAGQSLAASSAEYKANQASLSKLQTASDQVQAFENTAGKNLDLYLQKLENIPDLKVKFLNTPIRAINEKMIGTQAYQEMKAAQQTASSEVAKVLSSASATGTLTNEQKKEANDIVAGNLSLNAARGVVATLHQDMGNRTQSNAEQISDIKKRLGPATPPPATKPAGGFNWKDHPEYKP